MPLMRHTLIIAILRPVSIHILPNYMCIRLPFSFLKGPYIIRLICLTAAFRGRGRGRAKGLRAGCQRACGSRPRRARRRGRRRAHRRPSTPPVKAGLELRCSENSMPQSPLRPRFGARSGHGGGGRGRAPFIRRDKMHLGV